MKLSEDNHRTDLIAEINAHLPRPYKAYNSGHITFPAGDPRADKIGEHREFDVLIISEEYVTDRTMNPDRIDLVIETKNLDEKCTGIDQAEDAFTAFPSVDAVFATNFGDTLYARNRNQPERPVTVHATKLKGIITKIAAEVVQTLANIVESRRLRTAVPDEKTIIATLQQCMDTIQAQMTELPDEAKTALTERTLIMWQKAPEPVKKGKKTTMKVKDDMSNVDYNVKRAASYIIVDQLLFYHLLQTKSTKYKLPVLKPLDDDEDNPEVVKLKYIDRAMKDTGDFRPIFEMDMLSLLPHKKNVIGALNDVITKITHAQIELIGSDFLGKIFHHMIPAEIRKPIAAYYTGSSPARLLAALAIQKADAKVCDLACGSGTLLVESYHVKFELYKHAHPELADDVIHQKIIDNEIYGNDITLFASHLAAMNLAAQNLNGEVSKINITSTDGLKIMPDGHYGTLKSYMGMTEAKAKGVAMAEGTHDVTYPKVDVVIMNPPFSRQTDMSPEMMKTLTNITTEWFPTPKEHAQYVDGKMGLHGFFILHANHMLAPNGTIAMVLPSSTFTTDYTTKILAYLQLHKYSIEMVMEILSQRSAFSEDCTFKEYMVILRKGKLQKTDQTTLISFKNEFGMDNVADLLQAIRDGSDHPNIIRKTVSAATLYASAKWSEFFNTTSERITNAMQSPKLEDFEGNTSQLNMSAGYHATYSDYLMLPNEEWTITPQTFDTNPDGTRTVKTYLLTHTTLPEGDDQRTCIIPAKYCLPAIRSAEDANQLITEPRSFVLDLPADIPTDLVDFQRIYLHWAEQTIETLWAKNQADGHKRVDIVKKKTKVGTKTENPWYSHAHDTGCATKQGQIFGAYKYQPSRRRSIWVYSAIKTTINHGFGYIFQNPNDLFYSSWFSSSFCIFNIMNCHQVIHADYDKISIGDYAHVKFPKYAAFDDPTKADLIAKWTALAAVKDLPFLPEQFGAKITKVRNQPTTITSVAPTPERVALDTAWLKALGVADADITVTLDELYAWLREYMLTR